MVAGNEPGNWTGSFSFIELPVFHVRDSPARPLTQRADFAEFYRGSRNGCLRAVMVSVGDPDVAQDLVAEALPPGSRRVRRPGVLPGWRYR